MENGSIKLHRKDNIPLFVCPHVGIKDITAPEIRIVSKLTENNIHDIIIQYFKKTVDKIQRAIMAK